MERQGVPASKVATMLSKLRRPSSKKAEKSPEEPPKEPSTDDKEEKSSKRKKVMDFVNESWHKSKLKLEHQVLGLGARENAVPSGQVPDIRGEPRTVEIGWHPVAGFAGKWFAEKTGLGRRITEKLNRCPDPTQHWAVLVGGFAHELWMDEHLDVIYINEPVVPGEWHTFEVGKTRFNDEALLKAGEMTIFRMREKNKAYNLISNNCQNFALQMLDLVQMGKHLEFATAFTVYRTAVDGRSGEIAQLFQDEAQQLPMAEEVDAERPPHHVLNHAQELMEEHTTKVDDHRSLRQ